MKFQKQMLTLYAITPSFSSEAELCRLVEASLQGGATMVQLRAKDLSADALLPIALRLKTLCHSHKVPLVINDHVELALKSGADGVHVGALDVPVEHIRRIVPEGFIIGATAKTVEQALNARQAGADYLGVGAVFASPTKKDALRITKDELCQICSSVSIPCVAIGGICAQNIPELKGTSISGVAVVSSLYSAEDVAQRARELRQKVESILPI